MAAGVTGAFLLQLINKPQVGEVGGVQSWAFPLFPLAAGLKERQPLVLRS